MGGLTRLSKPFVNLNSQANREIPWDSMDTSLMNLNQAAHFFFQAEDGIRDTSVTGVQTCALPISWVGRPAPVRTKRNAAASSWTPPRAPSAAWAKEPRWTRSEERRVGKEGRAVDGGADQTEQAIRQFE